MGKRKWIMLAAVAILVPLPFVIPAVYQRSTALPRQVTIATGSQGGLYRDLMDALAEEIEAKLHVKVRFFDTGGSLDNLRALESLPSGARDRRGNKLAGHVDFALYQPGTLEAISEDAAEETDNVRFVANLYSQPAHLIVRRGAGIATPGQLQRKRVAVGLPNSGDYAMSRMLLEHFGLDEQSIEACPLTYKQVQDQFEDGTLDAALITLGVQAPIFEDLLADDEGAACDLLPIPCPEAFTVKHVSAYIYTIPQGLYRSCPPVEPAEDISTVALGAQLLTQRDVHPELVQLITRLITDKEFLKRKRLKELFAEGLPFAQKNPEFTVHHGAQAAYADPDFDIHLVESWEAIYSLVASLSIAVFLGVRWIRDQRMRKKEHRLDRHIRSLLEIERRQIPLDGGGGTDDLKMLQQLLDDVTMLRQEALKELRAHDLNVDRAADSFVSMCHALSNKINAKISRTSIDLGFSELSAAVKTAESGGDAS